MSDADETNPQPVYLQLSPLRIEGPARDDGYRPICDPLLAVAAILGSPPFAEARLVLSAARRLDAAHRRFERVRDGLDNMPPLESPAGRAAIHEVIGDAELAVIALDMALTIAVSLGDRFNISANVTTLVAERQPFVKELRNHYSHIDERAFGRIRGKPVPGLAEAAFHFDPLIADRTYTNLKAQSLGIDAEATELFVATRDYLVDAWKELVQRAVATGAADDGDDGVVVVAAANSATDALTGA